MPPMAALAAKLILLLLVAVGAGIAVVFGVAFLGHALLVRIYGETLASIDDTLPMIVAVWGAYLAGFATALVILVVGWRRLTRA